MEASFTRRGFIAGTALAAATLGLAGCAPKGSPESSSEEQSTSNWRAKPEPIVDIAETLEADVVVVGAGNGGMVAAMTALDEGAKVIVLEKNGQVASAREGIGAFGSRYSEGHDLDVPKFLNWINTVESGDANMLLYRKYVEESGEMMNWLGDALAAKDVQMTFEWWCPPADVAPEAYYPAMCHNPLVGGYNPEGPNYGMYAHLELLSECFTEAGGQIMFSTPARQLVQDDSGDVKGVIAESDEKGYIQINAAKGVIIATGGYGANKDMLDDLLPVVANHVVLSAATSEEGDGIRMALWAGAQLESGGGAMVWNRGLMSDDTTFGDPWSGIMFLPGSQPFFSVNALGERFMNEDQPYPLSFAAGLHQPGYFRWQIWDDSYWEDIKRFDTCGCSRLAPAPSGSALNADVYDCEAMSKEHLDSFWMQPNIESGAIKKCETLEELATSMGFDQAATETFLASVERYNELVAKGVDEDFGKEPYRMSALDTPPYYAAKMSGQLLATGHGIITDEYGQALREDGSAIGGLYVCGNDQGGWYPHNYPSNFSGLNCGRTCTFGRIEAKRALGIA